MKNFERKSAGFLLKDLLSDPERKSILKMTFEIALLMIKHKKFPRYYFGRYLFKKSSINITDYYPDNFLYYKLKPFLNDTKFSSVVENKLFFDFYFKQFGIPLPKLIMYNHKSLFVKNDGKVTINNETDFKNLISGIVNQENSAGSIFVKKTYGSYGGDQVYKLDSDKLNDNVLNDLYGKITKSGFLFQETIRQHQSMKRLNPSSVNSIRIDTFIDKDGIIHVISAYLRMSINNSHVDNISSGGVQVGIVFNTGKLKKEGFSIFTSNGVKIYYTHPVTGVEFENFEIPFFNEAKNLVVQCAAYIPGLRLVGWDVAIGESGPIIIECNADYDMAGNDLSEGGYKTNPVFRKILSELNYL